jgi:hypothetical protein
MVAWPPDISCGNVSAACGSGHLDEEHQQQDTKKISALCFVIVLTLSMLLAYWYVLRLVRAHIVAVHGALQIGHYCIILECQGFIFAPKLFPIVKERLLQKYYRASSSPIPKTTVSNL